MYNITEREIKDIIDKLDAIHSNVKTLLVKNKLDVNQPPEAINTGNLLGKIIYKMNGIRQKN